MNRLLTPPLVLLSLAVAAPPAHAADDIPAARVVLPWSDFKTLYDAGQLPDKPPVAPRDYAISRAQYTGRVDGEAAVFTVKMRVEVLKTEGWTSVPILPTQAALRRARIGNSEAPIYLESGWYRWVTDRPGSVDIEMEFAVNTWESSGSNGFAFQLPASAGTEVVMEVPAQGGLKFDVANAQQLVTEEIRDGHRVRALLPATGNLSMTWQPEAPETEAQAAEPRVYAEQRSLFGVSEGVLQCDTAVQYSILHAPVDHLDLSLPGDVTILEVTGQGMRDWSVKRAEGRQQIDVDLNFEAQGPYTLNLEYERVLPEGSGTIELPDVALEVDRVKGWIGVDARSTLEIAAGDVTGASVVDVRELPASILGKTDWPVLLAFKHRDDTPKIPLVLQQHDDIDMLVTIIDQLTATTMLTPDGRRMTRLSYAMRNNRAQFLRLQLPEGAEPWSTFVGGRAVKPAKAGDGRMLVPLARSQAAGGELSRFAVEVVYVEAGTTPSDAGRLSFAADLPVADVPATAVAWTVYVPWEAKLLQKTIDGTMRSVDGFTSIDMGGVDAFHANMEVQQQANVQFDGEATAAGVQPVRVTMPLDGEPWYFEKLLVLDEVMEVSFDLKGMK